MRVIKKIADKFMLGFCNVCKDNCYNDCGTQTGCSGLTTSCDNK
ncbi:MAG: Clo7bot family Cys-rich peptide [Lachnospiraceae bacterium]|nr:Clo7bot family Cys-rich peptide [Lachnospiraceae bacterium]